MQHSLLEYDCNCEAKLLKLKANYNIAMSKLFGLKL